MISRIVREHGHIWKQNSYCQVPLNVTLTQPCVWDGDSTIIWLVHYRSPKPKRRKIRRRKPLLFLPLLQSRDGFSQFIWKSEKKKKRKSQIVRVEKRRRKRGRGYALFKRKPSLIRFRATSSGRIMEKTPLFVPVFEKPEVCNLSGFFWQTWGG